MGFPLAKRLRQPCRYFFLFFFWKPQFVTTLSPSLFQPFATHCTFPRFIVTPRKPYPTSVPVMRATPESMITSWQWKVICRFTARWTCSITLLQFSHFLRMKSFAIPRACPPQRNIVCISLLYFFVHSLTYYSRERSSTVYDKYSKIIEKYVIPWNNI